jgi:hypothetical protein
MARMYGGLCAGAIAAHLVHGFEDIFGCHNCCTPLTRTAVDGLEADGGRRHPRPSGNPSLGIGQLGQALLAPRPRGRGRATSVSSEAVCRQCPTYSRGSRLITDPLDAAAGKLSARRLMSNSRYLKLVEPRLATRTFIRAFPVSLTTGVVDAPGVVDEVRKTERSSVRRRA